MAVSYEIEVKSTLCYFHGSFLVMLCASHYYCSLYWGSDFVNIHQIALHDTLDHGFSLYSCRQLHSLKTFFCAWASQQGDVAVCKVCTFSMMDCLFIISISDLIVDSTRIEYLCIIDI